MGEFGPFYERYWSEIEPGAYDRHAHERFRLLMEHVKALEPGARIIDYGCGQGDVTAQIAALGYEAEGVDIAVHAIERAAERHPGIPFHVISQSSLKQADACVCFEVIEHVLEPRELLRQLRSILKPGGYLALSTPHHGRLKNIALVLLAFERHFAVEGPHIRFFTDHSLRNLMTAAGFEVLDVRHFGRIPGFQADTFVWARAR